MARQNHLGQSLQTIYRGETHLTHGRYNDRWMAAAEVRLEEDHGDDDDGRHRGDHWVLA